MLNFPAARQSGNREASPSFIQTVKYINVICFLDFSVKLMKMSPQALVVVLYYMQVFILFCISLLC